MTTIDPSINAGRGLNSINDNPDAASSTRAEPNTAVTETAPVAAGEVDTLDNEGIRDTRGAAVLDTGLGTDGSDPNLLDDVLARLKTENGDLDDLRSALEAVAQQREALAARRVEVALELERTASTGIEFGQGYLDDAVWKPGVKIPGLPAETYDAAFTYASTSALLEQSEAALTSGGGVRLLDAAERNALQPPAFGDVFMTEGDFRIDYQGHETRIYEKDDNGDWKLNTRIWGDPHVDEKGTGNGDDWHFGEDSTFILPDGTKLSLNTKETQPGNGIYFTVGIDIQSGTQRAFAGEGFDGTMRNAGVANDRVEFDAQYADTRGTSGGVFALVDDQWAKLGENGFQDVETESWQGYLQTRDALGAGDVLEVSEAQALAVSGMGAIDRAAVEANQRAALSTLSEYAIIGEDAVSAYRGGLREQMSSLDEQLHESSKDMANLMRLVEQQGSSGTSRLDDMVEETLEEASEATGESTVEGEGTNGSVSTNRASSSPGG